MQKFASFVLLTLCATAAFGDAVTPSKASDAKPREVGFEVKIESPTDQFTGRVSGSSSNNDPWTFEQARLDLNLNVMPRLNEDQTITLIVRLKHRGEERVVAARLNPSQSIELYLEKTGPKTPFLAYRMLPGDPVLGQKTPSAIVVSIKATAPATKNLPVR